MLKPESAPRGRSDAARFRLVALDVDGTLKPREGIVSPRVREAIAATLAAGVEVTLATGRMFRSAQPFAEDLGIRAPLICYGGALVRDPRSREVLLRRTVTFDQARQVVAAAEARGLTAIAYVDDDLFVQAVPVGSPLDGYVRRSDGQVVDDLLASLPAEPCHMAVVSEAANTRRLVLDLREEFGSSLGVTCGHPLLAEVDHPAVSKGNALAVVAERLGVEREQVLAAGDDWNDVAMLEYAGLGVAMGDAQLEALAAADVVAPTALEDGVAWILERFVLSAESRQ